MGCAEREATQLAAVSSAPNHRRGHGRIQERGPRYERLCPAKGCNATHVARSRSKWKRRVARVERRTRRPWAKWMGTTRYALAAESGSADAR